MTASQKRNTQTKEYIKQALTILLTEEKFEDISVSKITRKSGINRGTFYLHYIDKYDLMEQLKEETWADMKAILTDSQLSPRQIIQAALDYMKSDFNFLYAISRCHYVNFSATIKEFLISVIDLTPNGREHTVQYFQIPETYALKVLTSSIEGIISHWIAQGGQESTEELTDIILKVSKFEEWT
ncbi:TetR family transcriptional regulator [Streptococcus suis]|uniref:TetR/AcrR family transcriptional regulator n=1 Tax=Streptococcus suis TaxID=1307 RepID=UPI0005CEDA55|nr:TetR/AcrR family transcriptional regulator [Streptococcus suis]NQH62045.1 TetR/AcrR family transcriptional regulator [Streptococcus suis]UTI55326.1 TetR/AcrR family transcriptional regulator [Streptococcus suis]CYV13312.1 TetR family transcriptional regulator [Streptococcus suis]